MQTLLRKPPVTESRSQQPVTRTWKRDGSTNVMLLSVAAANVARNNVLPQRDCYRRLLAGEEMETRHATFELGGML